MEINNFSQLTKKNIAHKIQLKTGLPLTYCLEIIDDLISSLKTLLAVFKLISLSAEYPPAKINILLTIQLF